MLTGRSVIALTRDFGVAYDTKEGGPDRRPILKNIISVEVC